MQRAGCVLGTGLWTRPGTFGRAREIGLIRDDGPVRENMPLRDNTYAYGEMCQYGRTARHYGTIDRVRAIWSGTGNLAPYGMMALYGKTCRYGTMSTHTGHCANTGKLPCVTGYFGSLRETIPARGRYPVRVRSPVLISPVFARCSPGVFPERHRASRPHATCCTCTIKLSPATPASAASSTKPSHKCHTPSFAACPMRLLWRCASDSNRSMQSPRSRP